MITLIQKPFLVSVTKGPKFRSAPLAPFVNVINVQKSVINVWHIRKKSGHFERGCPGPWFLGLTLPSDRSQRAEFRNGNESSPRGPERA